VFYYKRKGRAAHVFSDFSTQSPRWGGRPRPQPTPTPASVGFVY